MGGPDSPLQKRPLWPIGQFIAFGFGLVVLAIHVIGIQPRRSTLACTSSGVLFVRRDGDLKLVSKGFPRQAILGPYEKFW